MLALDCDPDTLEDQIDTNCDGASEYWVPTDFATLQDAIDASVDGDRVCADPGWYAERLDFGGRAIALVGIAGADTTTLYAEQLGRALLLDGGEGPGTRIEGFTVTGGEVPTGEAGGGMFVGLDGDVQVVDCVFYDNQAEYGGGIGTWGAHLTVTGSTFTNNQALAPGDGGAIHFDNDYYGPPGLMLNVEDSTFDGNSAHLQGGAIWVTHRQSPELVADGSTFTNNLAGLDAADSYTAGGSAIYFSNHLGLVSISDSVFQGNTSPPAGASDTGALTLMSSLNTITGCLFEDNGDLNVRNGGAIHPNSQGGSTFISDSRFVANAAWDYGGAIAGPYVGSADVVLTIEDSVFDSNVANTGSALVSANGGALFLFSPTQISGCTFVDNVAAAYISSAGGDAIHATANDTWPATITMVNSIVWNNDVLMGSYGVMYAEHSIWQGNGGGTVLDVDPLLNDGLCPLANSPAIDAGDTTAVSVDNLFDVEGNPRVVDDPSVTDTGPGGPPVVDMGACEAQ